MRHTFKEFIDRYYMLSEGLARGQLDGQGLKNAAVKIAKGLLGNADWQVGRTKIFLKVRNKDACLFVCLIQLGFEITIVVSASNPLGKLDVSLPSSQSQIPD